MATDIFNATNGGTTGTEKLGYVRIFQPNRIAGGSKTDAPGVETPAVSSIATKYDNRFDDPRYYSGDTAA
jgi:hypothetical protein